MDMTTKYAPEALSFTIVCDERCSVVRSLACVLKVWDRQGAFTFVDRDSQSPRAARLIEDPELARVSTFLNDGAKDRY